MTFKIKVDPEALDDIQENINWYNSQQPGLGKRFHKEVKSYFNKLKSNPFFQVRYDDVHCLPLKKFPYMIHYTINEKDKLVIIHAIFNTSRDPKIWGKRKV
jgi:toxin ParE1/3/4